MIVEILIFLLTTIVFYFCYTHSKLVNSFRNRGVKIITGYPIFGNFVKSSFFRRHVIYDLQEIYDTFPNEKYVGIVEGTMPVVFIRDPEVIKQVTVKDFEHFVDHRQFFGEGIENLFNSSLLMLKGEKWRSMRSTLSPAFTGSKMRQMVPFMNAISQNIVEYLKNEIKANSDKTSEDLNIDDLMRRYTNDVIASAAFGLEVNSMTDKNNDFYVTGQKLGSFTTWQRIKMMILTLFPKIATKIQLQVFPEETENFFRNIVKNTMDYRDKNNVNRPDMIQLLMEAAKGTLKALPKDDDSVGFATTEETTWKDNNTIVKQQWTPDDLTSQAFIFFFAGFESSASVLVMTIHELALNPDVQVKLYEEVKGIHDKNKSLGYESIQDLKYLDMVINETFRKWSPAVIMDRECIKPYELPPLHPGAKPYRLEKGDIVYNAVNMLHMDAKYYPDPDRFDPERFSEENKNNIKPFTFMPFGMGPRNCIGSRFALLEIKVVLYHLILNFEIMKTAKTGDPLRLKPSEFSIRALNGTWVKLRART